MSNNMPGNPYAELAENYEDPALAALSLAYEQRTATLLQFLMWEPTRGVDSFGAELQKQIVQRLGLDQEGAA